MGRAGFWLEKADPLGSGLKGLGFLALGFGRVRVSEGFDPARFAVYCPSSKVAPDTERPILAPSPLCCAYKLSFNSVRGPKPGAKNSDSS